MQNKGRKKEEHSYKPNWERGIIKGRKKKLSMSRKQHFDFCCRHLSRVYFVA